jgi:hypothetical protein
MIRVILAENFRKIAGAAVSPLPTLAVRTVPFRRLSVVRTPPRQWLSVVRRPRQWLSAAGIPLLQWNRV